MKRRLVIAGWTVLVFTIGFVMGLVTPARAHADSTMTTTVVSWGGTTDCIEMIGASQRNPWALSVPTQVCSNTHVVTWTDHRLTGQWLGADPIMGNADWISCSITDGYATYSDFASRGDGTDVTCLRYAT